MSNAHTIMEFLMSPINRWMKTLEPIFPQLIPNEFLEIIRSVNLMSLTKKNHRTQPKPGQEKGD